MAGPPVAGGRFVFRASNDTLYRDPDGTGSAQMIAVVRLVGVNSLTTAANLFT